MSFFKLKTFRESISQRRHFENWVRNFHSFKKEPWPIGLEKKLSAPSSLSFVLAVFWHRNPWTSGKIPFGKNMWAVLCSHSVVHIEPIKFKRWQVLYWNFKKVAQASSDDFPLQFIFSPQFTILKLLAYLSKICHICNQFCSPCQPSKAYK